MEKGCVANRVTRMLKCCSSRGRTAARVQLDGVAESGASTCLDGCPSAKQTRSDWESGHRRAPVGLVRCGHVGTQAACTHGWRWALESRLTLLASQASSWVSRMSARPHKVRPAAESLLSGQCSSCCSRAPDGHVGGALHRDLWRSDGRQLGAGACAHRCRCARRLEQPLHARRGRLGGVLLRATTRCAAGHAPLKHHHHLSKCSLCASPPLHHLLSSPRSSLTTYHSLLTSHLSLTSHLHPYRQHRARPHLLCVCIVLQAVST